MLLSIGWMQVITHVCHVLFIGQGHNLMSILALHAAIDWLDAGYNPCVPCPFIGQDDNIMSMLAQRVLVTGG
jgi:hypothetical protein